MNNQQVIIETSINQLRKLAMVAGFAPQTGLYNGRMGIIIVLYTGASFFNLNDVEEIADLLLEDLLDEVHKDTHAGFSNGIVGIGWGIDYLTKNNLVEADRDFYNDIDTLMSNHLFLDGIELKEFLLSGLYLLSRSTDCHDNIRLKNIITEYFTKVFDNVEMINRKALQINNSLIPILYCLERLDIEFFNLEDKGRIIFDNSSLEKFKSYFVEKYTLVDIVNNMKMPLRYINEYFFDALFYATNLPELPMKLLDESIKYFAEDKKLLQCYDKTLNPLNLGLRQSFTGYVWSLLQYCKIKSQEMN